MAELKLEIDPGEAGFDAERLARIDAHFARYVDDGRLPGWLIVVSRGGHVVHLSTYGERDKEAGLPIELDTIFRMYSMTKPVTSVAAMMLYEQGAFELKDPVGRYIPSFDDVRVYRAGAHVRVPPRSPRRCDVPRRRLRVGIAAGEGPRRVLRRARLVPVALPARDGMELRGQHRCARSAGRGRERDAARRVLPHAHLRASGDE
jgi:hypothetical protein